MTIHDILRDIGFAIVGGFCICIIFTIIAPFILSSRLSRQEEREASDQDWREAA